MAKTILENYDVSENNRTSVEQEIKPDIIVIQNESLTDFIKVGSLKNIEDPLAFQNSLSENIIRGDVYVSVLGGGTANTEFEVLSSISLAGLYKGTFPYQTLVTSNTFSAVDYFKQMNYKTFALHPYNRSNYSRERVYPTFGFDESYFTDSDTSIFDLANEVEFDRYIFMSDKSLYEGIINLVSQNDGQPNFVFAVTIQGHGAYDDSNYQIDSVYAKNPQLTLDEKVYFTSVKKSDQAFKYLIDYFSSVNKPTVIIMYGDHQPILSENFYKKVLKNKDSRSLYITPLIIWANYPIPSINDVKISANYLMPFLVESLENTQYPLLSTAYYHYLSERMDDFPLMTSIELEEMRLSGERYDEFQKLSAIEYSAMNYFEEFKQYFVP